MLPHNDVNADGSLGGYVGCERCDDDCTDGVTHDALAAFCWRCGWELAKQWSCMVDAADTYSVGGECISCGCSGPIYTMCTWCGGPVVDEVMAEAMHAEQGGFASPVRR